MSTTSLATIIARDLRALRREIEAYPDEAAIWEMPVGLPNSAGVLVRHLCGNLRHFVGGVMGDTGYRRDRPAEFESPPTPRVALLADIAATEQAVRSALGRLPAERLTERYPVIVDGQELVAGDFLIHLAVHLGFHLGQVDYHRRTVTGNKVSMAPMLIPELASARPGRDMG